MSALLNYDKIKGLVYTEKSNKQSAENKYSFEVDSSCNKKEIASLVKKIFGSTVEKINVINTKSSKNIKFTFKRNSKYPTINSSITI